MDKALPSSPRLLVFEMGANVYPPYIFGLLAAIKMLTYRLENEFALILVSAVDCGAPGSASAAGAAGNARPTATIEHVTKLTKDDVAALTVSLAEEWKAVLTLDTPRSADDASTPQRHSKDPGSEYWSEDRQRKVRRLVSEPAP